MAPRRGGRRPDRLPPSALGADATPVGAAPVYLGRRTGSATHAIVGALLMSGLRHRDDGAVIEAVAAHPVNRQPTARMLAGRQRLALAVGRYFRRYVPRDCELVGLEVRHVIAASGHAVRFDIVWRTFAGRIVIDELKTDRRHMRTKSFKEKLERYRIAALELYGEDFDHIRVLLLRGAPGGRGGSFRLFVDGSIQPLEDDGGE